MFSEGPYYGVSIIDYIVSGVHPDTTVSEMAYGICLSKDNGEWKLDRSDGCLSTLDTKWSNVYPKELLDASAAGRNLFISASWNFMYLDDRVVYKNAVYAQVKFAWQNADGSISLLLWLANGTEQNVRFDEVEISLKDKKLGEILSGTINVNKTVRAGYSVIRNCTVAARDVGTRKKKWTDVQQEARIKG